MKKNKILAFLLSLSIVTCLLSNLNPKSSDVAASEIFYVRLITFALSAFNLVLSIINYNVIPSRDCSTKKIPNNNKIKNDFRLCEKIKLKR